MAKHIVFFISCCILLLTLCGSLADTLTSSRQSIHASANTAFLFLVQPAKYELSKPNGEEKQTQPCKGALFKVDSEKVAGFVAPRYVLSWCTELVNEFSPKGAIVADDGSFIVTVNDCSANPDDNNSIVIYDSQGKRIHALALSDIFSSEDLAKIPRSTSSVLWFFGGTIDAKDKLLELSVWDKGTFQNPVFRKVKINLETGKVVN